MLLLWIYIEYWYSPKKFFKMADIQYLTPANAANINLLINITDYHISTNTLEHIPYEVLRNI